MYLTSIKYFNYFITNTLNLAILTIMALSEFKSLDSIATPFSVNAIGRCRIPPQLEVTICELLKFLHLN